jgi:hypothetical protein
VCAAPSNATGRATNADQCEFVRANNAPKMRSTWNLPGY